jgi:hypothetical protein
MAADRVIRRATAGAVAGAAAIASYAHALVRAHGEAGRTRRPVPLTTDGLIHATSIVMPGPARRKVPVRPLARWLPGPGIAATPADGVAHSLGDGLAGATMAAWPAVTLAGSHELLMMINRSAAGPPEQSAQPPARRTACGIMWVTFGHLHIKHESTSPSVCQCCAMGIPGVAVQPVDEG